MFFLVSDFTISTHALASEQYKVDLERQNGEPLSPEEFYKVVFFTARTVYHTMEAVRALEAGDVQTAMEEDVKARLDQPSGRYAAQRHDGYLKIELEE